ncbi:hypothetical protein PISMIDRAFT_677351 [Pisolithus microcarpus 441]|uniref:Unplaced genomic scaffold scaffold_25, whole genome shotgun sequence n=1 Tax=Pisolithus microcarpus 441 TaxID=765257 RepID=A0A0C9ZSX2_9AGAM|nr:hypothetical protein PISMIDRAFT_677351 [Pisolithus microcarpus 441]
MLVKLIKLFGSLFPHEPRLAKKLQPPITDLISTTTAISLLYECVQMCIIGNMLRGPSGLSLAQTCISKLADQNLKYIALLALVKIMPTHVDLVAEYQDVILASVDDNDISIHTHALELVTALVNKHNLQSIVQQLFSHLVQPQTSVPSAFQSLSQHVVPSIPLKAPSAPSHSPAYRLVLSERIISMCSDSIGYGAVRAYAVKLMVKLLSDETLLVHTGEPGSCSEVLWAAAWICGEYCSGLLTPEELLPYLLRSEVANLDPDTVAVYLQAAMWTDDLLDKVKGAVDSVTERLEGFISSPHIEVQEQAANIHQLFAFVKHDLTTYRPELEPTFSDGYSASLSVFDTPEIDSTTAFPKSLYLIHSLFSAYELNPVALAAQASVPVPVGLDLDTWIVPSTQVPIHDEHESEVLVEKKVKKKSKKGKEKESSNGTRSKGMKKKKEGEEVLVPLEESETPEEIAERERAERLERMREDPYYIIDDQTSKVDDIDSIPIKEAEIPEGAMPATPQSRSAPITRQQTPSLFERIWNPPPILPSFQHTPEPIKVTKAKRKGTGTGKKKRTTGAG